MTVLLLGTQGQLGQELAKLLPGYAWGEIHALSRAQLDLTDLEGLKRCLQTLQPQVIFNASAYTAVDLAEKESVQAQTINHHVPAVLAQYANSANAVLVHYSTDFVFDGQKNTPYLETDLTHPLSVYGQSKLEGEKAIEASACQHLIFRTGWLMGAHGQNFLKTMLRLAKERKELKVIADQHGAPTSAKWLAWVSTLALSKCLALKASSERPPWGLYHASSKGETTWHAYAQEAIAYAQQLGAKHLLKAHEVLAIPSTSYPLPAKRPSYSVLSTEKLERTFDIHPPLWSAVVREVIEEIEEIEVRGGLELKL